MIISCPHCQTKYQVTYEAIGSAGRKVQCAHCQQAWDQGPVDEEEPAPAERQAEAALVEDGLDDAMSAEEQAAAARPGKPEKKKAKPGKPGKTKMSGAEAAAARAQTAAGKIDPSVIRRRRRAYSRGKALALGPQPLARLRTPLRIAAATLLVGILAFAYFGRVQVVQRFPAMAGVYAAMGLNINVVGLQFSNVTSLRTLRDGKDVLLVSAQIVGLSPVPVPVPAVVVTLIGTDGEGVYQWSVQPSVRNLMAGERSTFDTQLTLPPGDAARVRVSFAGGSGLRDTGDSATPGVEPPAADADAAPAEATPTPSPPASPEHH